MRPFFFDGAQTNPTVYHKKLWKLPRPDSHRFSDGAYCIGIDTCLRLGGITAYSHNWYQRFHGINDRESERKAEPYKNIRR